MVSLMIFFCFGVFSVVDAAGSASANTAVKTDQAADSSPYDPLAVANIMGKTDILKLKAKSSILIDADTGTVLLESNSHEKLPIASVTKIMSMILIMEEIDSGKLSFDDKVTISEHSYNMGGSQVYLEPGEVFSVADLLKAVAIHSANDATVALAEKVSGSEDYFVTQMNEKTKALGMNDTNFLDCTGLTDEGHYSSAYDVALMSRELITKHPRITDFTSTWHDTFRQGTFSLDNTNKLVRYYQGTTGLKTGFTTKAGFCLSVSAKKGDMNLIAVVLGEPDSNTRFAEARKLLDYGFANFESVVLDTKGSIIKDIQVKKGVENTVKALLSADVTLLVKKGSASKITKDLSLNDVAEAPINAGQKLGEAVYSLDGKELCRIPLIAANQVKKASFINLFFKMVLGWLGIGRDN